MYAFLADLILYLHALIVAFVVIGFLMILIGMVRHWQWVRNFWLRLAHLLCMVVVTVQALCGNYCPLTVWENQLRQAAGEAAYPGSFVQSWVARLIYYDIPLWVFAIVYSLFTLLVLLAWIARPPVTPWRRYQSEIHHPASDGNRAAGSGV